MRNSVDNNKGGPNLQFFRDFLKVSGATNDALVKGLGVQKPSIYHWFTTDDVRLSYIFKAAELFGYNLYVSISDSEKEIEKVDADMRRDGVKLSLRRLHFLTYALQEQRITKIELAKQLGIRREAISYWYAKDDITIKNLLACARVLKRNVNFRFVKITEGQSFNRDAIHIRSSIISYDSWEIPASDGAPSAQ